MEPERSVVQWRRKSVLYVIIYPLNRFCNNYSSKYGYTGLTGSKLVPQDQRHREQEGGGEEREFQSTNWQNDLGVNLLLKCECFLIFRTVHVPTPIALTPTPKPWFFANISITQANKSEIERTRRNLQYWYYATFA